MKPPLLAVSLALLALSVGCAGRHVEPPSTALDEVAFREHVRILASDDFEGRKPGTAGEQKTVSYLVEEFRKLGLKPGNGASFTQAVPLVELTAIDTALSISGQGKSTEMAIGQDAVIWTKRVQAEVSVEASELVFVGHGVVAPEYDWDDYAGVDMRGKTAVMLVNDPGFFTQDPALFKGRAMTYYGRWTYKFEEAARHGAAAVLIVHDAAAAGYGWNVIQSSWTGPQLDRVTAQGNAGSAAVEGWISAAAAKALFAQAGMNIEESITAASHRGFKARPMNLTAASKIRNTIRYSSSSNVLALLPGSDRPKEYVVYTAHWDHFGTTVEPTGTKIFHGAIDNATGVAAVLTLAQSLSRMPQRPARSIVFLCTTGEEAGLLGSAYYVEHPLYPLKDTAGVINIDAMHVGGPTRDVSVVGFGNSELENYLRAAAALQGRELRPDPKPEEGEFFRSDHFSFAKSGVPALFTKPGIDDTERGPVWGQAQVDAYFEHRYHQPSDVYSADWDVRGTMQDLELFLAVGERLAHDRRFPNWYPNSEFRAIRERDRPEDGKGRPQE